MNLFPHALAASLLLGTVANPVLADSRDSLEGRIQSIDAARRSFVVGGQTLLTTAATDYDDGPESFADLKPGMKVKVDHSQRGGQRFARDVELDD
ncbi:hypothetical protein L107_03186 [Cyanobium sp. Copco_Reservoir_LC18]|uniref:DUF5666 domain-containing protein n=1 Tax=Cyanobium sp. Copco_Reservoir_LC18 TaxID=1328305 RepID=UPI00135A7008|nr:DUF5666 domain-containing protein [Cyanobium sp. Copco_Reservoir_LC18]KAF0654472.1 hypothetical protein L107_03186 [Cyanobium sp. Copco_Reservoir_LC18]